MRWRGIDPAEGLVVARPRPGEHVLRTADILDLIQRAAPRLALVLMGGVNYYTGQVFEMEAITVAAHAQGALVGFDLAHAAGNVVMRLHDWNVDFAAWCTYKYLNSGPGAVAGAFVHERHTRDVSLPRFGGWWGNAPQTRFRMHLNADFTPVGAADGWQLSNPPILSLAPVKASMAIFDEVGIERLRAKSLRMSAYLRFLLDEAPGQPYQVITPREPEARGAQLSILALRQRKGLQQTLHRAGVICDFRPPNVVRVAPVPLYNTFHEIWRFAQTLRRHAELGPPA
jgi:kynureninase